VNENYVNAQPGAIPGTTGLAGNAISVNQIPAAHAMSQIQLKKHQNKIKKSNLIKTVAQHTDQYGYKTIDIYAKRGKNQPGLIPPLDFDDNKKPFKQFKYSDTGYNVDLGFKPYTNVIDYHGFVDMKKLDAKMKKSHQAISSSKNIKV
jgi:hypothetical protein